MDSLPKDIFRFLLSYLEEKDLKSIAQVCKRCKTFADDEILWHNLSIDTFLCTSENLKSVYWSHTFRSWKKLYNYTTMFTLNLDVTSVHTNAQVYTNQVFIHPSTLQLRPEPLYLQVKGFIFSCSFDDNLNPKQIAFNRLQRANLFLAKNETVAVRFFFRNRGLLKPPRSDFFYALASVTISVIPLQRFNTVIPNNIAEAAKSQFLTVKQSFALAFGISSQFQCDVNSVVRYDAFEENAHADCRLFGLVDSSTIFEIAGSLA